MSVISVIHFDLDIIGGIVNTWLKYSNLFIKGLWMTLGIAAAAVAMGSILGSLIGVLSIVETRWKWLNTIIHTLVKVYVTALRGTPILVQLYLIYFFLPEAVWFLKDLPKLFFILLALTLNSSAYVAEIIRGGINSVDKGQTEAARSLGMTSSHNMIYIVFPQAIKSILPALGNEYIMMVKETSLASTLSLHELMFTGTILRNYFLVWQPLFIIAIIYLIVTLILTSLVGMLERRLSVSD